MKTISCQVRWAFPFLPNPKLTIETTEKKRIYHIHILLLELDQNSLKQSLYRCGKTSVCKVFKLLIPTSSIYRGGSSIKTWIYVVQKRKYKKKHFKVSLHFEPYNRLHYDLINASFFSGNLALWDQHLALHWIQRNIIHFGGDH